MVTPRQNENPPHLRFGVWRPIFFLNIPTAFWRCGWWWLKVCGYNRCFCCFLAFFYLYFIWSFDVFMTFRICQINKIKVIYIWSWIFIQTRNIRKESLEIELKNVVCYDRLWQIIIKLYDMLLCELLKLWWMWDFNDMVWDCYALIMCML